MSWSNYTYHEPERRPALNPGKYRIMILSAEQTVSKNGKNMLKITFRPSGAAINIYHYIVDGEYFDDNMNRFLNAFPGLYGTDFSIDECSAWRGYVGAAQLINDENGYLKVKYFLDPEEAERLPEFVWINREDEPAEMPEPTSVISLTEEDDDGELPFEV